MSIRFTKLFFFFFLFFLVPKKILALVTCYPPIGSPYTCADGCGCIGGDSCGCPTQTCYTCNAGFCSSYACFTATGDCNACQPSTSTPPPTVTPPPRPSPPVISGSGECTNQNGGIRVTWPAVTGATYYQYRVNEWNPAVHGSNQWASWSNDCNNLWTGDLCNNNLGGEVFEFPTKSGFNYGIWVHACNSSGCSDSSNLLNYAIFPFPTNAQRACLYGTVPQMKVTWNAISSPQGGIDLTGYRMRADNLINGWYNSTGVTATTDYNDNVTTTSWTRPIALNQNYRIDIQGLQAASSNYPIVSCRGPFATVSCPDQPSCSLTVNGTAVTSSTQAPINVCEGETVTGTGTSPTGALNTGVYYALDVASSGTDATAWKGTNPTGVSASYSWVAPDISTMTTFNMACNSRNSANVSCTGNPYYSYDPSGASGFMDCGVKDKIQVNVYPKGLSPGATCTLACQCTTGVCTAGKCACTSDAQCGGTLGCNLSTGLCETKPACNQACTTGGVACTQIAGLPAGQTIGCSANLCKNLSCAGETDCICPATVTGTLFDATNFTCTQAASAPKITGVTVSATSTSTYTSPTSDATGKYTISNVPVPGTYTITANPIALDGLGYQVSPKLQCQYSTSTVALTIADSAQTKTFDLGFWKSIPSWFQIKGGNILAEQVTSPSIRSTVPDCPVNTTCTVPRAILARRDLETTDPFTGYPVVGQLLASAGDVVSVTGSTNTYARIREATSALGQTFGERGRVSTITPIKNYAYFWQLYSMGTSPPTGANTDISSFASNLASYINQTPLPVPERGAYYVKSTTGTVTIANSITVPSTKKIVIFVDGNLTVSAPITVAEGGYLAFIVKGNITFANTLSVLNETISSPGVVQGVYVADNSIIVQSNGAAGSDPNDGKFVGEGVFVGWGGISLNRDFRHPTNNTLSARNYYYPTELFIDRPDLALNIPSGMTKPILDWQEVAP